MYCLACHTMQLCPLRCCTTHMRLFPVPVSARPPSSNGFLAKLALMLGSWTPAWHEPQALVVVKVQDCMRLR